MRALAALLWLWCAGAAWALSPDAAWPAAWPEGWRLGEVSGVAVDRHDHVWVLHRPATAPGTRAPPVIELDEAGRVVRGWGGKGAGYDWFGNEHSITVDTADHVWLTGNGARDGHILEFDGTGRFLRQIGHPGEGAASNDVTRLGRPAGIAVDRGAGEVFVADGYGNRRVIVFDIATGAYKRHWGAYGGRPDDAPGARRQFGQPVHCVHLAGDGLVYVCDRRNDRVQIFRRDGAYVGEWLVAAGTRPPGSVWDIALTPGEATMWLADGGNERLRLLRRADGAELAAFGAPGAFRWLHSVAVDSRGRVYTGEVTGRRVRRFVP